MGARLWGGGSSWSATEGGMPRLAAWQAKGVGAGNLYYCLSGTLHMAWFKPRGNSARQKPRLRGKSNSPQVA